MKLGGLLRRTSCSTLSFLLACIPVLTPAAHAAVRIAPVKVSASVGGAAAVGGIGGGAALKTNSVRTVNSQSLGSVLPSLPVFNTQTEQISHKAKTSPQTVNITGQKQELQTGGKAVAVKTALPGSQLQAREAQEEPAKKTGALRFLRKLSLTKTTAHLWDNARAERPSSPVHAGRSGHKWFGTPEGWKSSALSFGKELIGGRKSDDKPEVERFDWKPQPDPRHRGEVDIPQRTGRRWIKDKLGYLGLYLNSFHWRVTSRTVSVWRKYKKPFDANPGKNFAVKPHLRLRFFLQHLTMGSTGRFGPFGLRVTSNRIVVGDAWALFNNNFQEDRESTEAFARLVARAQAYNPNRRATQFRKLLEKGLLHASSLSVEELPAYFDSLAGDDARQRLLDYQKHDQERVLGIFDAAVRDTILEMNRELPRGQRIVGALLMGSFVNGAAGPDSDLDLQAISENGSVLHLGDFTRRLNARWKAAGMAQHPIGLFQYALPISIGIINSMHREPYMIFSPYPEVAASLQRSSEEDRARRPSMQRRLTGVMFHAIYLTLLAAVIALHETARFLARRK